MHEGAEPPEPSRHATGADPPEDTRGPPPAPHACTCERTVEPRTPLEDKCASRSPTGPSLSTPAERTPPADTASRPHGTTSVTSAARVEEAEPKGTKLEEDEEERPASKDAGPTEPRAAKPAEEEHVREGHAWTRAPTESAREHSASEDEPPHVTTSVERAHKPQPPLVPGTGDSENGKANLEEEAEERPASKGAGSVDERESKHAEVGTDAQHGDCH